MRDSYRAYGYAVKLYGKIETEDEHVLAMINVMHRVGDWFYPPVMGYEWSQEDELVRAVQRVLDLRTTATQLASV
jgi:hypothetical protein